QEAKSRRFISSPNFYETASFLAVTALFMTHESSKLPTVSAYYSSWEKKISITENSEYPISFLS
ncbi:hypothetical protein, partial [Algoriphagus algorifonticola]|uniref:hypothetical protein n=1 Tax=Algoriphagus algorifonticola TaxID=2593007 RepID=UPI001C93026F